MSEILTDNEARQLVETLMQQSVHGVRAGRLADSIIALRAQCKKLERTRDAAIELVKMADQSKDRAERRIVELERDIERRESEEASVCPEDVGVVEYVQSLRAETARLREALERQRTGLRNLLEVRRMANGRYGNLTKEEIEAEIELVDAALSDTGPVKQELQVGILRRERDEALTENARLREALLMAAEGER